MSNYAFNQLNIIKKVIENSRIFIILIFGVALFLYISTIAEGATYTVSNTNDNGEGSLRHAIAQADTTEEEDTIVFDKQVFSSPKVITLTSGELNSMHSIIIEGPGANLLTISGNNKSRIFYNNYSYSVLTIKNLTLTEGFSATGGAIFSSNTLKLSDLVITKNKAVGYDDSFLRTYAGFGGGIFARGELIITNSIISNNTASGIVIQNTNPNSIYGDVGTAGSGGGIFIQGHDPKIVNCTFINNMAKGISSPIAGKGKAGAQGGWAYGGAIYGDSALTIVNSTFTSNSAVAGDGGSVVNTTGVTAGTGGGAFGGAIYSRRVRILNSTFNNNSAVAGHGGNSSNPNIVGIGGESKGGAIYDFDLETVNITLADNSVIAGSGRIGGNGAGGGIFGGGHQWKIINSTITGNSVTGGTGTEGNGLSEGGGVFSGPQTDQVSAFHNNIVAENSAASGADIFGYYINPANNIIGKGEGAIGITNATNGNLVGTANSPINPMLAPLADNGGLTKTRALLPKSPAINAGKNASAIHPVNSQTLQFDQRNLKRIFPAGGIIDIGAFELGATSVPASASPDLRSESDTGILSDDNITKAAMPVFNVLNTIPGARVELLRNNVVVSSNIATSFSIFLTDPNAPSDDTVQYTGRQTIDGITSEVSSSLSVKFDHTPPTVTINQSPDQSDPATNYPIRFTVVFSEPAGGFEREDISFEGSTADLSNAAVWINFAGGSTYNVEITGIRSPGIIVATIRAQAAYDQVVNYSSASTSTDNSVSLQPNLIQVSGSGRVRKLSGRVRTTSTVTFTDTFTGETFTARTNPFGYYNFTGLPVYQQIGKKFTVKINNKAFIYNAPSPIIITGNWSNLNFTVP